MAGHEIGARHQIGGANGLGPKAQMRHGHGARLFGVIDEIALRVTVGFFTNDFNGILVRTHRAIGTQAVKERADDFIRFGGKVRPQRKAGMRHVVVDADGKMVLGGGAGEVGKHRFDHGRREFLGRKPITPAQDFGRFGKAAGVAGHRFINGRDAILIERFARRAGLLGAVQHRDGLDRFGQGFDKSPAVKGAIQPDLQYSHPPAALIQIVHCLVGGFAA